MVWKMFFLMNCLAVMVGMIIFVATTAVPFAVCVSGRMKASPAPALSKLFQSCNRQVHVA